MLLFGSAASTAAQTSGGERFGFGRAPAERELARFFAIPPSGVGLPPGEGTAKEGALVYAAICAACHGSSLLGVSGQGEALVGGRGTLRSPEPAKTVESYWPYASTIFDYVKRAMPLTAPGSLSNDQIYAVTAFILFRGNIIRRDAVLDARTLPAVRMPNQDGMTTDRNWAGETGQVFARSPQVGR